MTRSQVTDRWRNKPDDEYRVRVEFPDNTVAYTTIERAADRLDFIDRDRGIADLKAGVTFRSAMGSTYAILTETELRALWGDR